MRLFFIVDKTLGFIGFANEGCTPFYSRVLGDPVSALEFFKCGSPLWPISRVHGPYIAYLSHSSPYSQQFHAHLHNNPCPHHFVGTFTNTIDKRNGASGMSFTLLDHSFSFMTIRASDFNGGHRERTLAHQKTDPILTQLQIYITTLSLP